MLLVHKSLELSRLLADMLLKLKNGSIPVLEYGEPGKPGGTFSHLRVTWMMTAGGMQFRVCQLTAFGAESSGLYFTDIADCALQCMLLIDRYHRSNPVIARLRGIKPGSLDNLTWFTFTPGTQRQLPSPQANDQHLADATIINL